MRGRRIAKLAQLRTQITYFIMSRKLQSCVSNTQSVDLTAHVFHKIVPRTDR